ncbi:MAG: helix-turn-helix transcriptional regulator [Thermoanaerobaculales bacterium]
MPRGNQLIRQWRLLRAIEASRHGRSAAQLHREVAELGSPRTVYRDLEALQGAGFPLYQDDDGRWRLLAPSEGGPAVPIQPTEMIALLLSEQVMAPLRGSELAEPLVRLRSKLEAMMGPQARAYVEQLRGGLLATVPAAGEYGGRRDEIARIEQGIREHRQLRLIHFSAHRGDTLERIVDPYGIWYVDGGLYLIAFDHLRSDHRKYLVDRIREVTVLAETFEPDPDFDLQSYVGRGFRVWHGAVHHIVVEFEAALAHLPHERRFHRTQKVQGLPDGRCRVTFEAAGLPELAGWVASFGGLVRALEPGELVEMVVGLHRAGLGAHHSSAGTLWEGAP